MNDGSTSSPLLKPTVTVTPPSDCKSSDPTVLAMSGPTGGSNQEIQAWWERKGQQSVQNFQVNYITIFNPQAGDKFTVTVDQTDFSETYTASSSVSSITTLLTAQISATATGVSVGIENEKIKITGVEKGKELTLSVAVSKTTGSFAIINSTISTAANETVDGWIPITEKSAGKLEIEVTEAGFYRAVQNDTGLTCYANSQLASDQVLSLIHI